VSGWPFLAGAILVEVAATLSLRVAATGRRVWYLPVAGGYLVAFGLLSLALGAGMPLGLAYGVWTACGVALTAVAARFLFDDPLTPRMALGIVTIAAGVLLVRLGAGV
jgi:small multidrug resistance pump